MITNFKVLNNVRINIDFSLCLRLQSSWGTALSLVLSFLIVDVLH